MPPDRLLYAAEALVVLAVFAGIAVVTIGWLPKAAVYGALMMGADWQ